MRYMGSLFPPGETLPSHEKVQAALKEIPALDPHDFEVVKPYAPDLNVRPDLVEGACTLLDGTEIGRKRMITRLAIGGAAGLVLGGALGYFLGGR